MQSRLNALRCLNSTKVILKTCLLENELGVEYGEVHARQLLTSASGLVAYRYFWLSEGEFPVDPRRPSQRSGIEAIILLGGSSRSSARSGHGPRSLPVLGHSTSGSPTPNPSLFPARSGSAASRPRLPSLPSRWSPAFVPELITSFTVRRHPRPPATGSQTLYEADGVCRPFPF